MATLKNRFPEIEPGPCLVNRIDELYEGD